ncbi:MAG: hypothetical protein FJW27_15645 [Acidimicrobiia bacterium]|nr:hypothetical protein [Acidimicrobiia bacterium]
MAPPDRPAIGTCRGVRSLAAVVALCVLASGLAAQSTTRRATNLASVLNYPAFYQLRPVLLVGTFSTDDKGLKKVADETGSLQVIYKGNVPDGLAEVRGEVWDLGRMNADDPRLASMDLRSTFQVEPDGPWPRPGQVLAVVASGVTPVTTPNTPSIRNMVLFPARYRDQKVTIVGQFAGRNLLGDLPDAPARSRYDFVLRSADSAIWVSNLRPRGKDFELALDARIDTGRWLEVTGILQQGRGLQWLDGEAGSLKLAKAPDSEPVEVPVRLPAAPPPEVIFSTPTEGETDVEPARPIRIQFSRDIAPGSLKGRVRVEYAPPPVGNAVPVPITDFATEYRGAARVLEVKFAKPLERFRTVRVTFSEGVLGTDQQPLKPWTLTFETGQ